MKNGHDGRESLSHQRLRRETKNSLTAKNDVHIVPPINLSQYMYTLYGSKPFYSD